MRAELRSLIQFIQFKHEPIVETGLKDSVISEKEGDTLEPETFENYKER